MPRVYLDHAAGTPMLPAAVAAMAGELARTGNASSLHASGRAARRVVEESRERIAACLGARPAEVVLTSGATEADNLAVKGAYWAQAARGRREIVITAVEHHAVLEAAEWLAVAQGAVLHRLPVDRTGTVRPDDLDRVLSERTALVSAIWAGNEVGAIQPVAELARRARAVGAVAHSDAVQAVGQLPVDFAASGLDLLALSGHKLGGPRGIGVLLARREVGLAPLLHGGGQERDVRSGTVDAATAAGLAAALELVVAGRAAEADRLERLRTRLLTAVRSAAADAVVHGPAERAGRLPGLVLVGFPGCSGEALLMLLDAAGIDVSTGSACSAGLAQPSHVLLAMGADPAQARSVLRFSLGHSSTDADVDALAGALPEAVARARAAGALSN